LITEKSFRNYKKNVFVVYFVFATKRVHLLTKEGALEDFA
jgi:hypothetical protein